MKQVNEMLEDNDNVQKIALLGLAAAGKTSIIKTILKEFNLLLTLTPTKGVERSSFKFLGREILIWDFGGQQRYKAQYFRYPERFFSGIKYIYYIVDAQNEEELRESMDYFLTCFEYSLKYSPDAKIVLFFHKIDPNYNGKVDFPLIEGAFLHEVLPVLQPRLQEINTTITAFHTSIFDPLSVISAFSQPLLDNSGIYNTLCQTIQVFCVDNGFDFGILFVQDYFEIGHYLQTTTSGKVSITNLTNFLREFDIQGISWFPEFNQGFSNFHTKKFTIEIGHDFPFYFSIGLNSLTVSLEKEDIRAKIDTFLELLQKILRNSEIIRGGVLRTEQINRENKDNLEET